jgi:hypothetical protein
VGGDTPNVERRGESCSKKHVLEDGLMRNDRC